MTTCPVHDSPGRMCPWCGQEYCDADDHGHSEQTCLSTIWQAYEKAQNEANDLRERLNKAVRDWMQRSKEEAHNV